MGHLISYDLFFFPFLYFYIFHERLKYEIIQWKKKNKENTSKNEGDMRKNADRVIEIY